MVDFPINVKVNPATARPGTRQVVRQLQAIEKQTAQTSRSIQSLGSTIRRAFAFIGAGVVARQFAVLSDSVTNLQNRLRLVTQDASELADVQERLFRVSLETRQSFEGTAQVFTRLAQSSKELGVSNEDLLTVTERLNQATALSGATTQEARNALIQLSQGLASGALRGDELRSVLEQLPVVADTIGKSIGATRGELRLLGAQGVLTSEVIVKSLLEADNLAQDFATTVPTIGQSFNQLGTASTKLVGSLNEALQVGEGLARALGFVAEQISETADIIRDASGAGLEEANQQAQAFSNNVVILTQNTKLLARIQNQAAQQNRDLTEGERREVDRLTKSIAFLTGQVRERTKVEREQEKVIQDTEKATTERLRNEARQSALLSEINKKSQARLNRLNDLKALLDAGKISQDDFNNSLGKTNKLLEDQNRIVSQRPDQGDRPSAQQRTDFFSGVTRGIAGITAEARNLSVVGEDVVNVFANTATDALASFLKQGELTFDSLLGLANSFVDQLIDTFSRAAIAQLIGATLGGGAGFGIGGGGLNAGFADGGTAQPGQAPRLVGERGPEVFAPGRTGSITPIQAQSAPPQLNQNIVVISDASMVGEEIGSGNVDDALVIRAGANQQRMRQALGFGPA